MEASKKKPTDQKKLIETLQNQAEEYLEGWKRCKADFENFKKNQEEWKNSFRRYATEAILEDIIPVIDNFELAIQHMPETKENEHWGQGILHIKKQLEDILTNHGIKKIEINQDDPFDPAFHECIEQTQQEECTTEDESKKSLIVEKVVRPGYLLGDKLLRPARVTVKSIDK